MMINLKEKWFTRDRIFYLFFFVFVIRILFLILIPPYIGIANNGDFERLMDPVGLKYEISPWDSNENYDEMCRYWVTNRFLFKDPIDNGWHQIFSLFPRIAIALCNKISGGYFDIRLMGLVNGAFYFASVFLLLSLIKRIKGKIAYLILALSLIVLGDSYIFQYFNSFYTEIGSVTFLLFLWTFLIYSFLLDEKNDKSVKIIFLVFISISAVFAALCKQQDVLIVIPLIFIVLKVLSHFGFRKLTKTAWVLGFVLIVCLLFMNNKAGGNITAFNVISMDILANSDNPEKHLYDLGFDSKETEQIMSGVGKSSFTIPYDWTYYSNRITRKTELQIIAKEPIILWRMINKRATKLFYDAPLGNYTKDSGAIGREKTTSNRIWYNVKNIIYGHNIFFYSFILLLAIVIGVFGPKIKLFESIPKDLFSVYMFLPICNILRFLTVILGDGSFDDRKHFFTINIEFDFIFFIGIMILIYGFLKSQLAIKVRNIIKAHKKVVIRSLLYIVLLSFISYLLFSEIEREKLIGNSLDTIGQTDGLYTDGWMRNECSFKIRSGENGIIKITLWKSEPIKEKDHITVYIDERKEYDEQMKDDYFELQFDVMPNSVHKIKIKTTSMIENKGSDKRQLSLMLVDAKGE